MDQRSDDIRQTIESTRASLDQKLDSLESKARQTFDLNHQVSERPWMALGAAVAAGFVLGSLGGSDDDQRWHGQPMTTTDYNQHAYAPSQYSASSAPNQSRSSMDSFMSQFDDEIEMLKGAAISAITNLLHDSIREYLPAMGKYMSQPGATARPPSYGVSSAFGREPSSASNTSYSGGAGQTGFDSPPGARGQSSQLSNTQVAGPAEGQPYYPPGSPGVENRDYVKTYQPPSAADRERAVGENKDYWREASS